MHSNNSWARGFMALFAIALAMGLALAASPAEAAPFLYVANMCDNTVSVIDTATNTVVGLPIPVGNGPFAVAVTPDGTKVYVANTTGNVSVIHTATKTLVKTVSLGGQPIAVAVTPDGAKVYVVNTGIRQCFGDPQAWQHGGGHDPGGALPRGVAITPDGTQAYVANSFDNTVSVIDTATNTVAGLPIPVGSTPIGSQSTRMGHRPTSRMGAPTLFR